MRLTSWNINSGRLLLGQVEKFLQESQTDVLCLQEIKCLNDQFPEKALIKAGYPHIAVHGQKGYHGVATISKIPFAKIERKQFCGKEDSRHIAVTLENGIRVHNFYIPAGVDVPDPEENDKFAHKLDLLDELRDWFAEKAPKKSVMLGDLNIAPCEHDVWSHKQLLKVVSHTPIEVEKLAAVQKSGKWVDVAREIMPEPEKLFSWWSYRAKDWRASNRGRRLDHIWVTPDLKKAATAKGRDGFRIHDHARSWERPSDHAPVSADFVL